MEFSPKRSSLHSVICLDLMGGAGRKQVLAVLLKLSVMEADSPFQWVLSSCNSVCKAIVSLSHFCLPKPCFKLIKKHWIIHLTFFSH